MVNMMLLRLVSGSLCAIWLAACSSDSGGTFQVSADGRIYTVRTTPNPTQVEVVTDNGRVLLMDSVKGGYYSQDKCCYLLKTANGWQWRERVQPE